MTLEEFKQKAQENEEWTPGWEAIEEAFDKLYPDQEFAHYGTNLVNRASLGGDQYLDGYSIYTSEIGFKHIVTFGMTELYVNEELFGSEWNNWGYEMTIKLKEDKNENCVWALDMLGNLARYTYTKQSYFEPFQYIAGNGKSICLNRDSMITALMTVYDTELEAVDSVYGKTEFIQLVGITQQELEAIKADRENAMNLVTLMKEDNPFLITDLNRTKSYL